MAESDPQWTAGECARPFQLRWTCISRLAAECGGDRKTVYCCVCSDLPADVAALPVIFFSQRGDKTSPSPYLLTSQRTKRKRRTVEIDIFDRYSLFEKEG